MGKTRINFPILAAAAGPAKVYEQELLLSSPFQAWGGSDAPLGVEMPEEEAECVGKGG